MKRESQAHPPSWFNFICVCVDGCSVSTQSHVLFVYFFFHFSLTLSLILCFAVSTSAQLFSILEIYRWALHAAHTAHAATVTKLTIIFYHHGIVNRLLVTEREKKGQRKTAAVSENGERERNECIRWGRRGSICINCISYRLCAAYLRTLQVHWASALVILEIVLEIAFRTYAVLIHLVNVCWFTRASSTDSR